MKDTIKLFGLLLLAVLPSALNAQVTLERDVIGASGINSSGGGLLVSWTVGEPAVTFTINGGLILSEGFQQYDFNTPSGINEVNNTGEISIYPNPTSDLVYYDIQTAEELELTGTVYDATGREVLRIPTFAVIDSYHGQLSLENLPAGIWTLVFNSASGTYSQTFRIVKLD